MKTTQKKLTINQQSADADLNAILLISGVCLALVTIFGGALSSFSRDAAVPVLLRTLVSAAAQFGVAGLGITVVAIFRKESFFSYGLKWKGFVPSVLLSALCFLPYFVFLMATGKFHGYAPLSVWVTEDVLASGFPVNVLGMLLIALAWGFFEGFNYVVISDKINQRFPSRNRLLNWGAIACAIICILIHGVVGVTAESLVEMLCVLLIIYGMLLVKQRTGNAWGSVLLFTFLWNAF